MVLFATISIRRFDMSSKRSCCWAYTIGTKRAVIRAEILNKSFLFIQSPFVNKEGLMYINVTMQIALL